MEPIQLGSLTLFPFGLIVGLCAIPALVCAGLGMKRRGLRAETASWFALLSVPLALLLSRLVYCLMQLDVLLGRRRRRSPGGLADGEDHPAEGRTHRRQRRDRDPDPHRGGTHRVRPAL